MNVVAKRPADEERPVDDGVEAARLPVGRIGIAARVKEGELMAQPILIDRELKRRHLCEDVHAPPGNPVVAVLAQHEVKRVGKIENANVPVARPAKVI